MDKTSRYTLDNTSILAESFFIGESSVEELLTEYMMSQSPEFHGAGASVIPKEA